MWQHKHVLSKYIVVFFVTMDPGNDAHNLVRRVCYYLGSMTTSGRGALRGRWQRSSYIRLSATCSSSSSFLREAYCFHQFPKELSYFSFFPFDVCFPYIALITAVEHCVLPEPRASLSSDIAALQIQCYSWATLLDDHADVMIKPSKWTVGIVLA